jgi:hypothetical protein
VNYVYAVVEGVTDVPVAQKIVGQAGRHLANVFELGGKTRINAKVPDFNRVARHQSWFVLRDLDRDDTDICIEGLRRQLLRSQALESGLALRFAVRSSEAWLLSDAGGIRDFFGVPASRVPASPDLLTAPKDALVALCRHSKRRDIRDGMVPKAGVSARVGPRYTSIVRRFVEDHWDIASAMQASTSLATTVERVTGLP